MSFDSPELNRQWRKLLIIQLIAVLFFVTSCICGCILTYNYVASKGGIKQIIVNIGKDVKDIKTEIAKEK